MQCAGSESSDQGSTCFPVGKVWSCNPGLPGKFQSPLVLKRPFARSRAERQAQCPLTTTPHPRHARCFSHPPVTREPHLLRHCGPSSPQGPAVSRESHPPNVDEARKVFSDLTPGSGHQTTQWKLNVLCFENLKAHVRSPLYQPGTSVSHWWASAPPFPWFWVR